MSQQTDIEVDVIEGRRGRPSVEPRRLFGSRGQGRNRTLDVLLCGAIAVAALVGITQTQPGQSRASAPTDPVTLGHPSGPVVRQVTALPGLPGDWTLLMVSGSYVVQVEVTTGTLSARPAPQPSTGAATASWREGRPLVLPQTGTAGNAVMSHDALVILGGAAATSRVVLHGPRDDEVWVAASGNRMRLVGLDGWPTDQVVSLPPDVPVTAVRPDGAGYLLVPSGHGVYATSPSGRRLVTRGEVVAVGASGWLARECLNGACHDVLVERKHGVRRVLDGPALSSVGVGLIAPDGRHVALPGLSQAGTSVVSVVSLAHTGATRGVTVPTDEQRGDPGAWSPDGGYLFVAEANDGIAVFDTTTGSTTQVGHLEAPASGLTVRSTHEPSTGGSPDQRCDITVVDRWWTTGPSSVDAFCRPQ
ncbi:MAG: hypothetical protein M3P23_15795 [Actinomycetota bacterium]|nr:hypothetical protein [Actinomycetota bacterium]